MSGEQDFIAEKVRNAIMQAIAPEAFLAAGKYLEREGVCGRFRLRPGSTKQDVANELGKLVEHATFCCRGVGFAIRVKETQEQGVSFDLSLSIDTCIGRSLVERG